MSLRMLLYLFAFFFFNDTATTEIYTLSLHDALPISRFDLNTELHGSCLECLCCCARGLGTVAQPDLQPSCFLRRGWCRFLCPQLCKGRSTNFLYCIEIGRAHV